MNFYNIRIVLSDAETALQVMEDKNLSETEWMTRIAVHYLSQLSVSQCYKLDSCCKKKFLECPCSCKTKVNYGDTSIGKFIFTILCPFLTVLNTDECWNFEDRLSRGPNSMQSFPNQMWGCQTFCLPFNQIQARKYGRQLIFFLIFF